MENTNITKKIKHSSEFKMVFVECLTFALGLLLTPLRFAMGIYPFGMALLCATTKYTLFAYAGAVFSIFFFMDGNLVYLIAISAVIVLRLIASLMTKPEEKGVPLLGQREEIPFFSGVFEESVGVRIFVSLASSFGLGLYFVIVNGYMFYDIFALVFFSALAPIMTYGFSGAFEGKRAKGYLISICTFLFSLIYLLRGREILGVDISIVLSYALVLYASKNISIGASATLGAILGLCGNIALAPVFAIAGIISGLIFKMSSYLAIMSAFILVMGYGIYTSGYEALSALAPEALGASLIMYPVLKFDILPRFEFLRPSEESKSIDEIVLQRQDEKTKIDLADMSKSFEEISEMLYETAKASKAPTRKEYEKICFELCEGYCYSCPKNEICWERDTDTTKQNILKMSDEAFLKNEVDFRRLDEKFIHRCPNVEKICEDITKKSSNIVRDGVKNDRLSISANNFELTSKMLRSICAEPDIDDEENLKYTYAAAKAASSLGLCCEKIEVTGGAKKHIIATDVDLKRSSCTGEELRSELERQLCLPLEEPKIEEKNGTFSLEISSLASYKTSYSIKTVPSGSEPNGDSVISFSGKNDKEYFLICDGMGTGDEAHLTSEMCTRFLEKILKVSSEKEVALSILNNFVRSKNVECSSSVDLLEIDLVGKGANFLKSGASPSFIKRGEKVFKLLSKTAPIGIMRTLDAEKLSFSFESGDICVMVSDGIASGKGDTHWINNYLMETESTDTEEIASEILRLAKSRAQSNDDMSIIVILFE